VIVNRLFFILLFLLLGLIIIPFQSFARLGVGVGTGKIVVDEDLKPGVVYELPPLNVLNTGDEKSQYSVTVTYHEGQSEKMPDENWFIFSPSSFELDPGEVQEVKINLNLPVRAEPGDYFAYLEAFPLTEAEEGNTQIGIAAAAKLYFTVIPGGVLEGIYYKILSLWKLYSPWSERIAIIVGILAAFLIFKKFFNIQVSTKKSPDSQEENEQKKENEALPARRRRRGR
jgi:hypothetical protein